MAHPHNPPESDYIKHLWDAYHELSFMDEKFEPGLRLYASYMMDPYAQVWIVTTRPERHWDKTREWIMKNLQYHDSVHLPNFGMPDRLVMRSEGCYKPSWMIKRNFLAAALPFVSGGYHLAIDNDPRVIQELSQHMPTMLFHPSDKIR